MWTIAAVNKKFEGPLGSYNGLTDVHLAHFFSRPSRRSLLKSAKLITEDGFIVPEKNVKGEMHLHEKKRKVYDILARSILRNAIHEEGSWNKKLCNYLEDISKMAAVDKARKTIKKKSNKVASELFLGSPFFHNISYENDVLESPSKSTNCRNLKPPNSAPVTCVCVTTDGWQKTSKLKRSLSAKQYSPYGMPLILSGSYKEHMQSFFDLNKTFKEKQRKQRKLNKCIRNSNNAKNIFSNSYVKVTIPFQALKLSQCHITMLYHGRLHLTNFQKVLSQNILIKQQHCGGTPVIIYKGKISANELLSFSILDHEGFFFSLTVFLNGIRELKLSSCCVFRYLPGRRLGGPNGTFSIKKIEGGKPCLKCQYQEYENNELKVIPQLSQISIDTSVNTENSHIPENGVRNYPGDKISLENYKPSSLSETNIPLNDESQKMTSTESYGNDDIQEYLDEEENQSDKNGISSDDSIVEEENVSSEKDEIKENEESDNSISSMSQSEISEKYVNDEQKSYQSSDTSSDEGAKNCHIVTASVHKTIDDN